MKLTLVIENAQDQWDAFVQSSVSPSLLQSWGWLDFQNKFGFKTYRFVGADDSSTSLVEAHAVASVVEYPLKAGARYWYVPRGPIFSSTVTAPQAKEFLTLLSQEAKKAKATFLRVDPALPEENQILQTLASHEQTVVSPKQTQPQHTATLDLTKTDEALLAAMKPKTRYNVNLSQRKGVEVVHVQAPTQHAEPRQHVSNNIKINNNAPVREQQHESSTFEHNLAAFLNLLSETASRDGFSLHERAYYECMWRELIPAGLLDVYLAYHHTTLVAGIMVGSFANRATYLHGASSSSYREVMAPHLLQWKAIQNAKTHGVTRYDFGGVAPEDAGEDHAWSGLSRFKEGFGGSRETFAPAHDIITKPLWYKAYLMARAK